MTEQEDKDDFVTSIIVVVVTVLITLLSLWILS